MRWVAGEPGQGRKAAALSRMAYAPWGYLTGAAEVATRPPPHVAGRCTVTLLIFDFRFTIFDWGARFEFQPVPASSNRCEPVPDVAPDIESWIVGWAPGLRCRKKKCNLTQLAAISCNSRPEGRGAKGIFDF